MSLLTGSACAPLISPVPPRHRGAHLCSSLSAPLACRSVSVQLADGDGRLAGRETGDGHGLKRDGSIGSIRNATAESSQPRFSSCCLSFSFPFPFHLSPLITLNLCKRLCSLLTTPAAQGVFLAAPCCCFVYTVAPAIAAHCFLFKP